MTKRIDKNIFNDKDKFEKNICTILFVVGIVGLTFVLFQRCKYGFVNIDEAFYLQTPIRLVQGDGLFVDEWHLSQMSAFILYPFMYIFKCINGSTEGMMLTFRFLYMAVQLIATTVIYITLKKQSEIAAVVTSLLFYIYVPFAIPALSYNSMGIIFLSLGLVLYVFSANKIVDFVAGIFMAFSVLCCPYLAIVYVLHFLFALIKIVFKRDVISKELTDTEKFIWYTLGIVVTAVAFLGFVFSRTTLSQLLEALPLIMDDPEHTATIKDKVFEYIDAILKTNQYTFKMCIMYAATTIIAMLAKNKTVKNICCILFASVTVLHIYSCAMLNAYINHIMLPINWLALFCWLSYREEKVKKIFEGVFVPGMVYTVCLHLASNQIIYAISSASTVAMVGSIVIIIETVRINFVAEKLPLKTIVAVIMAAAFLVQGGYVLHYRWNFVFWDQPIEYNTVLIEEGPYKGIYVTEERKKEYDICKDEMSLITDTDRLLLLDNRTYMYSFVDCKMGSFSTWICSVNDISVSRLDKFYEINDELMPDTIYVNSMHSNYIPHFEEKYGFYVAETTPAGNMILKR